MTYHIGRNGTQLGTFTEDKLQSALASGELQPTDLAWCEGMTDWLPLSEALASKIKNQATPPPLASRPAAMPATSTSGMAIASLVCGIVSVCGGCITGLPAIIFGVIALNRISKSGGAVGGKGMAITGISFGGVLMIFGTAILAGIFVPAFGGVQEKAKQMQAMNNARQIIIAMKSYAGDHGGAYPDADPSKPKTANEVFRLLIKGGYLQDERVFSAPYSPAVGDNDLGEAPDFRKALEPGENHWAVVTGLKDDSPADLPLIFECANDDTWPPTWNADVADQPVRGRAWRGGKIVVGRNDGSASTEKLEAAHGDRVTTMPGLNGSNIFDPRKPLKYLQPE